MTSSECSDFFSSTQGQHSTNHLETLTKLVILLWNMDAFDSFSNQEVEGWTMKGWGSGILQLRDDIYTISSTIDLFGKSLRYERFLGSGVNGYLLEVRKILSEGNLTQGSDRTVVKALVDRPHMRKVVKMLIHSQETRRLIGQIDTLVDYVEAGVEKYCVELGYVEGENLSERYQTAKYREVISINDFYRAVIVLRDLYATVVCLEANRCIHGDINPANVMLQESGNSTCMDYIFFGRAVLIDLDRCMQESCMLALNDEGIYFGTPRFFAPEQCRRRTKIGTERYQVGRSAIEMITGKPEKISGMNTKQLIEFRAHTEQVGYSER